MPKKQNMPKYFEILSYNIIMISKRPYLAGFKKTFIARDKLNEEQQ
jgi:hypothetical protein